MQDSNQYWCYINNSEEFEYIKSLPDVQYANARLKDFPKFPIVFSFVLRGAPFTPFWIFSTDSEFLRSPDLFTEVSFEEMKAQIFIYQLSM